MRRSEAVVRAHIVAQVPCETRTTPRPPAGGFLAWIPQVWSVPDSEIQNVAGMDALAFLRTQRLGEQWPVNRRLSLFRAAFAVL